MRCEFLSTVRTAATPHPEVVGLQPGRLRANLLASCKAASQSEGVFIMTITRSLLKDALIKGSFLLGLLAFGFRCVVEPR